MMLLSYEPRGEGGVGFEANGNGYSGSNGTGNYQGSAEESLPSDPSVPLHPLGIKPLGNLFLASGPNARSLLGTLQTLPDEVLAVLLEYLDQTTVRRLGYTCKFLFAFCSSDDIWKTLFLE
jgi:hypothetical protein